MAYRIEAGFDVSEIGPLRMTVSGDPAGTFTITQTTGTFCHTSLTSVTGYDDWAEQLQTLLRDAGDAQYGVTWDGDNAEYTINAGVDSVALTFTGVAGGEAMRQLLGFSGNQSSGLGHVSDVDPYYYLSADAGARSNVSDDYEPDQLIEMGMADDGTIASVAPDTMPIFNDFTIPFESKEKTFKRDATTSTPWTFQHFIEHVRSSEPFLGVDDNDSTVHKMRANAARFRPDRVTPDFDDHWSWPFETVVLGRL